VPDASTNTVSSFFGANTPEEEVKVVCSQERPSVHGRASQIGLDSAHRTSNGIKRRQNQSETKLEQGGHVFVDADAMKERVRKNLTKPKYDVKDFYKKEGMWQMIATSHMFEMVTLVVITLNAIWIAVDTDLNDAPILLEAAWPFQVVENMFCVYFTFEWVSRFFSFAHKRHCLKDPWFVFDSVLVGTMVLETWVMTVIILITGPNGNTGGGNASVLRVARLLRLSRMARMVRLLRAMPELMIMIKGMVAASRSVLFTLLLLILLMYVFAVAMTQLLEDTAVGEKYFGTVFKSMYSLWLHGTLLDDVSIMSDRLLKLSPIYLGIYFFYILLAALTVMNMLIGVLCEVVSATAATEKEEMLVTYVNEKLRSVVKLIDQDGSMSISKAEFKQILENAEAARCLQDVGVDVVNLVDFADAIFIDDSGEEELELSFSKFMEVVLNLRGSNHATVKDIVDLRKFIRKVVPRGVQNLTDQSPAAVNLRNSVKDTVRNELRTHLESIMDQPAGESNLRLPVLPRDAAVRKSAGKSPISDGSFKDPNFLLQALPSEHDGNLSAPWMPMQTNGSITKVVPTMSSRSNHCQQCVAFSTDTGYPTRQGSRRYGRSAAADAARAQHQDILGLPTIPLERDGLPWTQLAEHTAAELQWKLKHTNRLKVVLMMALRDLEEMRADVLAELAPLEASGRECHPPEDQEEIPVDILQGIVPEVNARCC